MNKLYQDGINFRIHKVKSHVHNDATIHEMRNNKVDKLARTEVQNMIQTNISVDCNNTYYEYYFNNNNNYVNAWHNRQYQMQCMKHESTFSDNNNILHIPDGDAMLNEMRLLTMNESKILNQIRMGYMTLPTDDPWFNNYICNCEDSPRLTVNHFLFECKLPKVIEARTDLQQKLSELNPKFQEMEYFNNFNNLLFPHLEYNSKELRAIDNRFLRHEHLKWIIEYCRYRFPD